MTDDQQFFGPGLTEGMERAVAEGLLRHRNGAWFFCDSGFPAAKIGLRSTTGEQYTIVEEETGDIVGTEGAETAFSALHPGAVYLHMGDNYLVTELDIDKHIALVRPFWDTYHTLPRRETDTRILSESLRIAHGPLSLHLGEIIVTSRVIAFQKKRLGSDEVLGTEELDLPAQEFVTEAMWFTIPAELLSAESDLLRLPGAIHAVEHALIALLPALRHVRPLGYRRAVHAGAQSDGAAHHLHLRRPCGRGGHIPAGLRAFPRVGARLLEVGA